jgi:predicted dehydrogenase
MPTLLIPKERQQWFRDKDRVWTYAQHREASEVHTFDYTDFLADLGSGITISSSAFTTSGVTTSSPSATTTATTVKVSGTDGSIKNTLTLSNSTTAVFTYRFVGVPEGMEIRDYA